MILGKKAALLTAAAGALVLVGAGGASAHGFGQLLGQGPEQSNECSTQPIIGSVVVATPLTPTGDITHDTTCVNYQDQSAGEQSNHCDTTPVLGDVVIPVLVTAPKITYNTTCLNVAGAGDLPGR